MSEARRRKHSGDYGEEAQRSSRRRDQARWYQFVEYTPLVWLIGASLLFGCEQQTPQFEQAQDIRTIENSEMQSIPIESLPVIREESMELQPTQTETVDGGKKPRPRATPVDKEGREKELQSKMELPFAPLIAMDPVDGSKVSIRVETPTAEYKDRLYYFSTNENRRAFEADEEKFLKGQLARY